MRCKHVKDDGTGCGSPEAFVDPGTGYCHAHGPDAKEIMAERGRKGAEVRNRSERGLDPEELPPLGSHSDAKRWLEAIGRAVATGRLGDRPAQAAIRAVSEWVSTLGEELVAEDVEALRDRLEALEGELGGRPTLQREK